MPAQVKHGDDCFCKACMDEAKQEVLYRHKRDRIFRDLRAMIEVVGVDDSSRVARMRVLLNQLEEFKRSAGK